MGKLRQYEKEVEIRLKAKQREKMANVALKESDRAAARHSLGAWGQSRACLGLSRAPVMPRVRRSTLCRDAPLGGAGT